MEYRALRRMVRPEREQVTGEMTILPKFMMSCGKTEGTRRLRRRSKQLLNGLKETRRYWNLKV